MTVATKRLITKNVLNGIVMAASVGIYAICQLFSFPFYIPVISIPIFLLVFLRTK